MGPFDHAKLADLDQVDELQTFVSFANTYAPEGMIFPILHKSSLWPEIPTTKPYFLLYSTDHGTFNARIAWGECDDPFGNGYVDRGILVEENWECESPFLIRIPSAKSGLPDEIFIYYHVNSTHPDVPAGNQWTKLITTSGGSPLHECTFNDRGFVIVPEGSEDHTGYAKMYELADGTYLSHHLTGDGNPLGSFGVSTSPDGINWTRVISVVDREEGLPAGTRIQTRPSINPFQLAGNNTQYGLVRYRDNVSNDFIGVCELDENLLPKTFIKQVAEGFGDYDGRFYVESDIAYLMCYKEYNTTTFQYDDDDLLVWTYYLPDALLN